MHCSSVSFVVGMWIVISKAFRSHKFRIWIRTFRCDCICGYGRLCMYMPLYTKITTVSFRMYMCIIYSNIEWWLNIKSNTQGVCICSRHLQSSRCKIASIGFYSCFSLKIWRKKHWFFNSMMKFIRIILYRQIS